MPHVDEGTLHALLDGALRAEDPARADAVEAHVAACAECGALLDRAAALRGRSSEVLDLLEPAVTPDFEEVLVRAGGSRGRDPARSALVRQARWTRGAAWAATIVIALGTGYLIRDRVAPEPEVLRLESRETEPMEQPESMARPAAAEPAAAGPAADEPAVRPPAEDAAAGDGGAEVGRSGAEERATGRSAGADDRPAAQAGAGDRPGADASRADPAVLDAPAPPPPSRAAAAENAPTVQANEAADRLREPEPFGEGIALESIVVTGMAAASPASGVAAPDAPVGRAVSPAEAATFLGAPLLVLPQAEVREVATAEDADGPAVVSVQRLATGVEVRVTQRPPEETTTETRYLRVQEPDPALARARALEAVRLYTAREAAATEKVAAADASQAGAEAAPTNGVRVRVDGAELVVEGPLPEALLRLLAIAAAPLEPEP